MRIKAHLFAGGIELLVCVLAMLSLGCGGTAVKPGPQIPAGGMPKPTAHTQGSPTGGPTGPLKPGEYWWRPELSPKGPLVVLVSVPEQTLHAYRNGILIGRSSVSTGAAGHSTPGGVFTILEKEREHYSRTYDNAPMPNMQRLTSTGIAMHSGNLPGYPASHGCIRMPYDFSQLLFTATATGGTVVVGDGKTPVPHLASHPGLVLAPRDFSPAMLHPLAADQYDWNPQRSPRGPITILVSAADQAVYVFRNGNPIGRASLGVSGMGSLGDHVFTLLDGTTGRQSVLAPGRAGRRWMSVTSKGGSANPEKIAGRLHLNPEFARKVYDTIAPGTTVVITDQPIVRKNLNARVLE